VFPGFCARHFALVEFFSERFFVDFCEAGSVGEPETLPGNSIAIQKETRISTMRHLLLLVLLCVSPLTAKAVDDHLIVETQSGAVQSQDEQLGPEGPFLSVDLPVDVSSGVVSGSHYGNSDEEMMIPDSDEFSAEGEGPVLDPLLLNSDEESEEREALEGAQKRKEPDREESDTDHRDEREKKRQRRSGESAEGQGPPPHPLFLNADSESEQREALAKEHRQLKNEQDEVATQEDREKLARKFIPKTPVSVEQFEDGFCRVDGGRPRLASFNGQFRMLVQFPEDMAELTSDRKFDWQRAAALLAKNFSEILSAQITASISRCDFLLRIKRPGPDGAPLLQDVVVVVPEVELYNSTSEEKAEKLEASWRQRIVPNGSEMDGSVASMAIAKNAADPPSSGDDLASWNENSEAGRWAIICELFKSPYEFVLLAKLCSVAGGYRTVLNDKGVIAFTIGYYHEQLGVIKTWSLGTLLKISSNGEQYLAELLMQTGIFSHAVPVNDRQGRPLCFNLGPMSQLSEFFSLVATNRTLVMWSTRFNLGPKADVGTRDALLRAGQAPNVTQPSATQELFRDQSAQRSQKRKESANE
jgi:hypothetical protein